MSSEANQRTAIEILQELGLKEYEARCFVGLSRLSSGTAKQLSEVTDVPRTRVYDAIRVLEATGLVEVQHSSPQRFRAVPLTEALETLRDQYEQQISELEQAVEALEPVSAGEESPVQEVWTLSSQTAIANRTSQLVRDATEEIVLVLGTDTLLTEELIEALQTVGEQVRLVIGGAEEQLVERIDESVPDAVAFESELQWLKPTLDGEDVVVGRLLLVDGSSLLVSSILPDHGKEHAVFGEGFENGMVVITRRLIAQGLNQTRDPRQDPMS